MPEKTADLWWLFTRQTVCATQNESVLNAAVLMQKRNFRHLPVITEAGRHFNRGQRAFFFALGYLGWFLGPLPLIITTAAVVLVQWRRQFASESQRAILGS